MTMVTVTVAIDDDDHHHSDIENDYIHDDIGEWWQQLCLW